MFLSVLFSVVLLVSCDSVNKTYFPIVSHEDKVEFTVAQAEGKIDSIIFKENLGIKIDINMGMEFIVYGKKTYTEAFTEIYSLKDEYYMKQKTTYKIQNKKQKMDITLYLKDNVLYYDLNMLGEKLKLKINYNDALELNKEQSGIIDVDNLEPGITFEQETFQDILDKSFLEEGFSGLTFYEKDNKLFIKIELNDENAKELAPSTDLKLKDFFKELSSYSDEFKNEDFIFEYLVIFEIEDNVLESFGMKMKATSENIKIDVEYVMTYVEDMPRIKNLDGYEDFEDYFGDILGR